MTYQTIRDSFGRMAMNDTETLALIGGGHALGKAHGACNISDAQGLSPLEDPQHPWAGLCGSGPGAGIGANAWTSGFEGPWTTHPTRWDVEYWQNLKNYSWEKWVGPGGHWQWRVEGGATPLAPAPDGMDAKYPNGTEPIMMMTSDVSLTYDPDYLEIVRRYADDIAAFDNDFAHAWYKLTTRDMGPVTRCVGADVPPAQPFQYPLPPPAANQADFGDVKNDILAMLSTQANPDLGPELVRLAFSCANTFRVTDYQGGCNGARIRFPPQSTWPINGGLDAPLSALEVSQPPS